MDASELVVPVAADHSAFDDHGLVRGADGRLGFAGLEPSLVAMLHSVTTRFADREAVVELDGARLTYLQLWDGAARVAGGLVRAGVGRGDRVAIRRTNGVDWCLAFFGALLADAVAVPVNPRLRAAEVAHIVADSGAAYVIGPDDDLPAADPVPPAERSPSAPESLAAPQTLAALFYTSGTTGAAKGAALSHRNILSAVEAAQRSLQLPDTGVRTLVPVPLFHVMGALNQLLPTIRRGGTAVIMPAFEVARWVRTMAAERIDVVSAVPAIYWQALRLPEFADIDSSHIGWVIFGGAATPPAQVVELSRAFPAARLFSGYGLTRDRRRYHRGPPRRRRRPVEQRRSRHPQRGARRARTAGRAGPGRTAGAGAPGDDRVLGPARGDRGGVRRRLAAYR